MAGWFQSSMGQHVMRAVEYLVQRPKYPSAEYDIVLIVYRELSMIVFKFALG